MTEWSDIPQPMELHAPCAQTLFLNLYSIELMIQKNPIQVKMLMNIYNPNFICGGYAGIVYDPNGVSPTLNTAQGGGRMPLILLSYDTKLQESHTDGTATQDSNQVGSLG